jgi:hypothetical protein
MVKYSKIRGRFTTRSRNKRVRRYKTKILYGGVNYILEFRYKDITYRIVLNEDRYKLEQLENIIVIEEYAFTEFITKLFQISHTEVHRYIIDNIYDKLVSTTQPENFKSLFDRLTLTASGIFLIFLTKSNIFLFYKR